MRVYTAFTLLILCGLLSVSFTRAQGYTVPAQAGTDGYPARYPWEFQYIQKENNPPRSIGRFVSAAIASFNDYFAIAYYDDTNHMLMIASLWPNHAGNCGTSNNWICLTLDGGVDFVGRFSSIDIWGESLDDWKMAISYYDDTHRALKAAVYTCYMGNCTWEIATILVPDSPEVSIGLNSSIKFYSTGIPAIVFIKANSEINHNTIAYAYPVTSGGNCGEGSATGLWQCSDLSFLADNAGYPVLDFNFDDNPYIAYYDMDTGALNLGVYTGGGLCGVDGYGWVCPIIDGGDANVGLYPSLIAPHADGEPFRIAYLDQTNGHLKYYDSDWGEPVVVDEMGTSAAPKAISMRLDPEGLPVIAYQSFASEFSPAELRLARPYEVYGEGLIGNCGDVPPGYLFQYWRCNTLDHGGQYVDEAGYASMVLTSEGLVGIAYTEYDSYNDVTSLKFAYQTYLKNFLPLAVK